MKRTRSVTKMETKKKKFSVSVFRKIIKKIKRFKFYNKKSVKLFKELYHLKSVEKFQ